MSVVVLYTLPTSPSPVSFKRSRTHTHFRPAFSPLPSIRLVYLPVSNYPRLTPSFCPLLVTMLTVKQFRAISLAVMVLAVILAIGSLVMTRFAKASLSSSQVGTEFSFNIGAFHACLDFEQQGISFCSTIDKNCVVTLLGTDLPAAPSLLPDWYKNGCTKFNVFRGMHVAATLLLCISVILAIVYVIVNPFNFPKTSLGMDISYCVAAAVGSIFYIICLISADQSINDIPTLVSADRSASFKVEKSTSFALTGTAVAFSLVALIVWIVARFVGRKAEPTGLEGMPLNDGSSPSSSGYVPPPLPGQPQQYFNYGAPAPQPNYQYGNAPNAPNTNYGFGYQPPPPQA